MVHYITYEHVGARVPSEVARIEEAIRSLGDAFQFMKNCWIVESEADNTQIAEKLRFVLRHTDRLLVTRIHKDWVASNIPENESEWLSVRNYSAVEDPPLFRR